MPYNNDYDLTKKEFFALVSKIMEGNPKVKTIEKYWEGFLEAIAREIYYHGSCRLPHLGKFVIKHIDEKIQLQKTSEGKNITYKVPERDIPIFIPHDDFINDINYKGVTKQYRKRLKQGKLTSRDYRRQIKSEYITHNLSEKVNKEEKIQKIKEDFAKKLNQLKEERKVNEH